MPTVSDDRFLALRTQGHTGATSDMLLSWLQANGATAKAVPDAWREVLDALSFSTGQFNDDWRDYLLSIAPPEVGTNLSDLNAWFWKPVSEVGNGGNLGGGGGQDLVWHAVTNDEATFEMLAQKKGEGTPTFTSSEMLLPDHEGVYRTIPANTAPWHGARIVGNKCTYSDDITNSAWQASSATKNAADNVTYTSTASNARIRFITDVPAGVLNTSGPLISLTANWTRVSDTFVDLEGRRWVISAEVRSDDKTVFQFHYAGGQSSSAAFDVRGGSELGTLFIRNIQMEFLNDSGIPQEFVATSGSFSVAAYANQNGNTVNPTTRVVTEAVGPPIAELPSLYAAPAMTNLVLDSRDLTQASWSQTAQATFDQVGITGEPSTATLLIDSSSSSEEERRFQPTITATQVTARLFMKKGVDSGADPSFRLRSYGSVIVELWLLVNEATGTTSERVVTGTVDYAVDDVGDWWVIYLNISGAANEEQPFRISILPANGATNTGDIVIGNVELFSGMTIADVRGAAPIITEGSTVTNSATALRYDPLNTGDGSEGLYYLEANMPTLEGNAAHIKGSGNSGRILYNQQAANPSDMRSQLGGTSGSSPASINDGEWAKGAVAYDGTGGNKQVNTNGAYGTEVAYATYSGATTLDLAAGISSGTAPAGITLLRNIQRWDLPYDAAKTKVDELMATPSWPPALDPPVFDADLVWAAVGSSYSMSENGGGDYKMEAQLIGSGSPTFTSSEMLLPDHEGVYRTIPANTAPWHGARVVANEITKSEDFTVGGVWQEAFGPIGDGGYVINPDNSVTFTTGGAGGRVALSNTVASNFNGQSYKAGTRIRFSFFVSALTGTPTVSCIGKTSQVPDPETQTTITSTGWWTISQERASDSTNIDTWRVGLGIHGTEPSACSMTITKVMVEYDSGPSEYVFSNEVATGTKQVAAYQSTNGYTYDTSGFVTENIGVPIDEQPSLYAAPAMTNLALNSNDMSSWSGSNTTRTFDQVGITGEPNTASLVQVSAVNANQAVNRNITVTTGGSQVQRVIAKAGNGQWLQLRALNYDNGSQTWFDLVNGVLGGTNGTGYVAHEIDDLGNGWYACYMEFSTTTDLAGAIYVYVADSDGSSGNSPVGANRIIGNIEVFSGMTIAQVRGAAPIITAGSTVTNVGVIIDFDIANASRDGAFYAEAAHQGDNTTGATLISMGSNSNLRTALLASHNTNNRYVTTFVGLNGGTSSSGGSAAQVDGGTFFKAGSANEDPLTQGVRTEFTGWGERSYSSEGAPQNLQVLVKSNGVAPDAPWRIRNIRRYDLAYAAAKAKIDELMS